MLHAQHRWLRSLWLLAVLLAAIAPGCKDSNPDKASAGGAGGAAGASGGAAGASGGAAGASGAAGSDGGSALPAPGPDANAATRIAQALAKGCGPESTAAAIEALARSGIETYDDDSGSLIQEVIPPALGLHVSKAQARGMGCEIASHGGTTGAVLNAMVGPLPLPDGSQLPASTLFAAYASTPGRFGSELAIALMGSIDTQAHATLIYPSIVVTTFLREVIVPMLAEVPLADWWTPEGGSPTLRDVSDPCAAISKFLDDLPGAVAKAVGSLSPEDGGFWSKVVSVASAVAGIATYATVAAAKTIVQNLPGMNQIRTAMTAVGAVVDLRSMFSQWKLSITPEPPKVHKSVGSTNTGKLVLEIAPPEAGFDWPQQVKSCATLLGIPLPNLNGVEGASVEWTALGGFEAPATTVSKDPIIASNKATFTFKTVTEDPATHNGGGAVKTTPAQVKVDVGLPGLAGLGSKIASLMGSPQASNALGGLASEAAKLAGPSTSGEGSVEYHEKTAATIDVSIGGGFVMHIVSCTGVYGPYNGTGTYSGGGVNGSGPATLSMDPTTQAGPLTVAIPFSGVCTGQYDVAATGTLGGTPTTPDVTFVGQVTGYIACPGGGGPLSNSFDGTYPVALGPAPECP